MSDRSKVTTYLKEIKLIAKNANAQALQALALQIEGQTKVNIVENDQVDTGFMLNSVYSVGPNGSTYGDTDASGTTLSPINGYVERNIAPEVKVDDGGAAVAVGAEYAVYQEAKQSFLLRAAETVAQQAGATVEPVFQEYVHD